MSDASTLEKIKESEDAYAKAIEKAKAEADRILKEARSEAEIIMHDAHDRGIENADSIKVDAIKAAKKNYEDTIAKQENEVGKLSDADKGYVFKSFSEALADVFGLSAKKQRNAKK
ncbi:MAG: hypothetical protein M1544_01190 [Candidatus Marsarchaeota archaeon]|nr:hypothetical protein [Candidatus Marsarchaeota archaeon]